MIFCGSWYCVENKKEKQLEQTVVKNFSPFLNGRNNN